ncbi:MAG: hypothetical protein ACR5K2_00235 [Wolbachia sp.]
MSNNNDKKIIVVQKGLLQVIDLRNTLVLTRKYMISIQSGSAERESASLIHNLVIVVLLVPAVIKVRINNVV